MKIVHSAIIYLHERLFKNVDLPLLKQTVLSFLKLHFLSDFALLWSDLFRKFELIISVYHFLIQSLYDGTVNIYSALLGTTD